MGPAIAKFLQAAASLAKKGVKEADILEFAKREFGEVSDLLKIQVRRIFKNKDAPSIKNPSKQEGEVIPFKKDQASGIMQTEEASPLMKRLGEGVEILKGMKKPGMDPTVALTRTLARSILNKKGIQIPERVDPIEVLAENFGADVLIDTKNVAEELLELQSMGKGTKSIDEILQQEGMFDIPINKDAPKGLTQEELRQIKKEVDQEKMFEDFDPTDRKPNSMGGLNRTNFATGTKLIMTIINAVKKLKPMDAMKEMNEVVAKRGKYKDLSDDEVKKIFDETNDHIFERDVPADEFAVNFDDEVEKLSELAPKAAERFKLKQMYPGIDEDFLTKIIDDPDPQRKAEVLAALDQSMLLMREGKSGDEVVDILKQETKGRKPNARGGLNYLMGM